MDNLHNKPWQPTVISQYSTVCVSILYSKNCASQIRTVFTFFLIGSWTRTPNCSVQYSTYVITQRLFFDRLNGNSNSALPVPTQLECQFFKKFKLLIMLFFERIYAVFLRRLNRNEQTPLTVQHYIVVLLILRSIIVQYYYTMILIVEYDND